MINENYNDCKVIYRLSNSFRRVEKNNSVVYIPFGKDINNPLIVNQQGETILQLSKQKKSIAEIIEIIQEANPDMDKDLIVNDVYVFLQEAVGFNILRIEGMNNMYNGEVLYNVENYNIYKCNEGDLREIIKIINSDNKYFDVIDSSLPEVFYLPVSVRARLFNFSETFYLLRINNDIICLLGFLHGKLFKNKVPLVSRFIIISNLDNSIVENFVKICLENFLNSENNDSIKIRLQTEEQYNPIYLSVIEKFEKLGFNQVAKFDDEMGISRNVIIYDFFVSKK